MGSDLRNNIILHIQYPFCDIRRMTINQSDILPVPNWQLPLENKHFVQYFGHMERRKKDIPQIFSDENFYIKGKGGLKFVGLEKSSLEKAKCLYKKLLSDGYCGNRYEVGLFFNGNKRFGNLSKNYYQGFKLLLEDVLCNLPVRIRHIDKDDQKNSSLLYAGKKIAQLYQKATEKNKLHKELINIRHGKLCLLFEVNKDLFAPPKELWDKRIQFPFDVSISFNKFNFRGEEITSFFLFRKGKTKEEYYRKIRVIILRMYFEYQNLKLVLNLAQNPSIKFNHELFDKYLMKKVRYFEKSKKSQIERTQAHELIFSFFEFISPSEIEILSQNLESVRLQIKKQIIRLINENHLKYENRYQSQIKIDIRNELMNGNIEEALKILNKISNSNDVALINFKYKDCLREEMLGIIGQNESEIRKSKIVFSILKIVDEI